MEHDHQPQTPHGHHHTPFSLQQPPILQQPTVIRDFLGKHLKKPDDFDGKDSNACHTFISQLRLYIMGNQHLFANDNDRVVFAASYLRGKAYKWIEPRLFKSPDEEPLMHNFGLFCTELVRNLGDPDREKTMGKKLSALTQTSSASAYRTEFDNISQYLSWDDSALRLRFYEGLKSDVKDALSYVVDEPSELKDFQDLAIRLDNRIFERKQEGRKSAPSTRHPTTTTVRLNDSRPTYQAQSTTVTTSGPAPMDLDGTRNRRFKPLTNEERARRIANNLCLYCGGPGHRASDCPVKASGPKKFNRLQATLVGPSDDSESKN